MAPKKRPHPEEKADESPLAKKTKISNKTQAKLKPINEKSGQKSPKRKDRSKTKKRKPTSKDSFISKKAQEKSKPVNEKSKLTSPKRKGVVSKTKKRKSSGQNVQTEEEIKRDKHGKLVFPDYPQFKPNLTPKEVLQAGSFGGTYFRPIKSSVTGEKYSGEWKEFPCDWFEGLSVNRQIASSIYHTDVNTYGVKCGGSLQMWESSGWIVKQDPYGWFQWYCRFYLGRRTNDDERQISRWLKCAGDKGRWRNNLITKIVNSGCSYDNSGVSPVVRQTLQHWGYRLNKNDYEKQAKKSENKVINCYLKKANVQVC